MKSIFTRVFPLLIIALIALSCNVRMNRTVSEIHIILDSLKGVYAYDTRIAYWKPEASIVSGSVMLHGEVADVLAYQAIIESVLGRYPEIAFDLRLLPEEQTGRLVNGLVNNSVVHIRSSPSHRAEMVTQAMLGTPLRILKEENDWFLVQTPNLYLGWLDGAALHPMNTSDLDTFRMARKVVYLEQYGFSYTEPVDGSQPVSDLVIGCILQVVNREAGYYQVLYPDGRMGWVKTGEVRDANEVFGKRLEKEEIVQTAMKFNGIPYLWGGASSKAMDCSGFTSVVYFLNGIILMRDANQQSIQGQVITTEFTHEKLLPGDLLFFGSKASGSQAERVTHVAIYMGDKEFIHASGKVRINSMDPSSENYIPEYPDIFIRAIRIDEKAGEGYMMTGNNPFYKEIISRAE